MSSQLTLPMPTLDDGLTYADLEGRTLADFTTAEHLAQLRELAGPWPIRWLFPPEPGDPDRAVNLCAGCGGWCVGLRKILGADIDMVCLDKSRDAVLTSIAAGCTALCVDITTLDPEHPALRWTAILIASPPCTDWTLAGKRLGHLHHNIEILAEAIDRAAAAAGNYIVDHSEVCFHDDPTDCEDACYEHYGPPSGESWNEVRAITQEMTAPTAGLMLEPIIWALALWRIGAPLHTIALEQSSALPEAVREPFTEELYCAGWEHVVWEELDAADYGSPSHRRRAFLLASRYRRLDVSTGLRPTKALTTYAAEAVDMDPETWIVTRGNRRTSGGNKFHMDRVIPGVTSKIRGWYAEDDPAFRFTLQQVAKLVTLPADHPLAGSRSSACQQAADVVAPVVSAAVFGTLLGVAWSAALNRYLAELYPPVHGTTPPIPPPGPRATHGPWHASLTYA
ncbi:DNA cytosine methyltransferase (plasmid) [Actinacidiphila glaucinigra]|uniref:DNA cytosine methyltransferase n=1 Tax=Actinacidiphila glaucinigra TaxID=235986 RepID=UPI002DDBFD1C|nr:DNA cytosine methyltransferase [Actinacidiphila glaucinigra]WSD65927.1 DNA cytosine methyltransferase [Actinacidiphila glaucinigra]